MKLNGLFFWQKNKSNNLSKRKDELMEVFAQMLPQVSQMINGVNPSPLIADGGIGAASGGQIIGRMYDFFMEYDNTGIRWSDPKDQPEDKRIVATPVSVMAELEKVPTPFNSSDEQLEEKIKLLKSKSSISNQRYAKQQIDGLILRLENRKLYKDNHQFFELFPNTTDGKIDALTSKYKLVVKTHDLFVPTFPKEAIDVMEKYTQATKKLCNEEPVFYVIAEAKDFEKKVKKLDPILLVQSPFGFYWQILGAWGDEMLILSEL